MNFVTNVLKKYIQNEPQESKETKLPDLVGVSDKENGLATENSNPPAKAGCVQLRRSFLKSFDPLYSESPEKFTEKTFSEQQKTRPQLIIEDSDTEQSQYSLPADVSDDDAAYVDATNTATSDDYVKEKPVHINKCQDLEESLLKFYSPGKSDITFKDSIAKSTSELTNKESVLEDKQNPTSVKDQSLSEDELSDSAEEKLHFPITNIGESKESSLPENRVNETEKKTECVESESETKQDKSNVSVAEIENVENDSASSNSQISDITTESPDKSKEYVESEEKLEELSEETITEKVITLQDSEESIPRVNKLEKNKCEETPTSPLDQKKEQESSKSVQQETSNEKALKVQDDLKYKSVEKIPPSELSDETIRSVEADEEYSKFSQQKESEETSHSTQLVSENNITCVEEEKVHAGLSEKVHEFTESGIEEGVVSIKEETDKINTSDEEKSVQLIEKDKVSAEISTPIGEENIQSVEKVQDPDEQKTTEVSTPSAQSPEVSAEQEELEKQVQLEQQEQLDTTPIHRDEEHLLDSGVESTEESYIKSPKSIIDDLEQDNTSKAKEGKNLPNSDVSDEECKVESDQVTSDDDSKTISEGSNQSQPLLTEASEKVESDVQTALSKPIFDIEFCKTKMADLSEKLSEQQQENSDLKLQLNASQQAKASLELEIRQKEEVIIKTQAEALKNEQTYKQEIKQLREKLKENSKLIEKDGSKELEEQLKEVRARETKAIAELNQRNKDVLNYEKIMEEYENTIATRFADFQKLKEEHETTTRHLANLELAFSDVHQKYERAKAIILGYKENEEALSSTLETCDKTCKQHEERYESLKAHAKAQIEKCNKEILMLRDKFEMDINKLKAIIKRLEIKCSSLEVSLQQKTEECAALSALCDEVTGKRV